MDPVTHALTGWTLSRTALGRLSPRAGVLMVLGALAPDADYVAQLLGPFELFRWHRGPLHSLLAVPLLAAAAVAAVRIIWRRPLPLWGSWGAAAIGVASHVLLDALNPWGVQLLWPFSGRWLSQGSVESGDPWIAALLLLAVAVPFLSSLVSGEIGAKAGRGGITATLMLLAAMGYIGFRWDAQQRAIALLESRVYRGAPATRTAAVPDRLHPMRWLGLVETSQAIYSIEIDLQSDFDPEAAEVHYTNGRAQALAASERLRDLAPHFEWAEAAIIPAGEETVIEMADLYTGLGWDGRLRDGRLVLERVHRLMGGRF